MQGTSRAGDALNSDDVPALSGDRQQQATVRPTAVHQNGAGPALAVITALFRPGQAKMVAQRVEQ